MLSVPSRRALVAPLAALTVAIAAGCGSSGEGAADPAAIVPARAPAYVEVTVAPEGEQRDDALAAAGKVLGTSDPEAELRKMLRDGGHGDVEPWLGEKVGAFALDAGGKGSGAVVAATSDTGAAEEWVKAQGRRTERHRDVDLHIDADGTAYALVEDRVVAGAPAGVKAAVDAAAGDALADADAFKDALDRVDGEDGIGRAYLAPRALAETGAKAAPQAGGMFGSLASGALTGSLPRAVGAKFHADGEAIRADVATVGGPKPGEPADSEFVAGLTGEAWAAAGIGDVSARLKEALGGSDAILGLLGAQAGLDIERELLAWMGEGAIFVTGDSATSLGGALVVMSKDPAATRAAVPKLGRLVGRFMPGATVSELRASGVDEGVTVRAQGVPAPVAIAAAGDRFVIAVGDEALREAVSPSSRLGDDAGFQAAAATLGQDLRPTAYVDVRHIGGLAAAFGGGTQGQNLQRTLERFTALVAADRGDGRARASLGLR